MKTFILIGGIGSGKSSVALLLQEYGATIIDLDQVGHACLDDASVRRELICAFGEGVLDSTGAIDRALLAKRAFVNTSATNTLNAIVHPAILSAAQERLDRYADNGCDIVVIEASAYAGPGSSFDALVDNANGIIAVLAPEDIRLDRAVASGFSEADVRARMQQQPTDEQRMRWADYSIVNDGSWADLQERVAVLWNNELHPSTKI